MGLWYPKNFEFKLTAYSDVDHAGCLDTCKSTSGGARFLVDKLVSWSSKKHDCIVVSTAESEYVSLSACCAQMIWMRTQLLSLIRSRCTEHVEKGTVELYFVKTDYQLADIFTKALAKERFEFLFHRLVRMVQDEKDVIRFRIDQKQVDLSLNPFCTILQLPQATTQKPFVRPTDFMTIEKFLKIVENEGGVPIAIKFAIKSLTQ
ncbi:hypothetical protein Tco_1168091 [Tanacetum coccineum]